MDASNQTPLRRSLPAALALAAAAALGELEPGTSTRALVGGALLVFWLAAAWRAGARVARSRGGPRPRALLRAGLYAYAFIVMTTALFGLLQALTLIPMTLAAALAWTLNPPAELGADGRPSIAELAGRARRDPAVAALVLAAATISCMTIAWALLGPPHRWDDLVYHFTYPVEWAQSGTLVTRDIFFGNHGPAWFPKTTELWYTALYLPIGEIFHLTNAQAPFLFGLLLVTFDLARRLGASTRAGVVMAAAVALTPAVQINLSGGHVDLPFAFLFMVTLDALFALREEPGRAAWLELMGAAGLLLGTKVQAVPSLVFVLAPLGALLLWRSRPRRWDRGVLVGFCSGAALVAACGGWWYLRNYALSGNPFFPLLTEVFGVELFDGAYDRSDLPPGDAAKAWGLFDHRGERAWALFTLAPYALGVIWASLHPRARGSQAALLAVSVATLQLLLLEHLVPFAYTRFALPVLAVSVLALLPALESPRLRKGVPLLILAAAAVQFSRSTRMGSLLPPGQLQVEWSGPVLLGLASATSGLLLAVGQGGARFADKTRKALRVAVPALCLLAAGISRVTSDPARDHCAEGVRELWAPGLYLEERAAARVAVCGTTSSLPLQGVTPKHTVAYVPVNAPWGRRFVEQVREAKAHRGERRGDRNGIAYYRTGADLKLWNANLDAFGADYLACYTYPTWLHKEELLVRGHGGYGQEAIWAEADKERFRCVFNESGCRIYEIVRH